MEKVTTDVTGKKKRKTWILGSHVDVHVSWDVPTKTSKGTLEPSNKPISSSSCFWAPFIYS
jgi:hypothetical protein